MDVVITGGTKGLGLATAELFSRGGARVILSYRSDAKNAEAVAARLKKAGGKCEVIQADLTDPDQVEAFTARIRELTSRVDVYVHNAAATAFKPLLELKPHHLQKTFQLTVFSFVRIVQEMVSLMPSGGAIVTVSGIDTLEAAPNHGALGAAKASLELLTRYFAHELASKKIRVNGVNPGFLDTDSTRRYLGDSFDMITSRMKKMMPSGKLVSVDEIAELIVFLSSPAGGSLIGQTVIADGGWTFESPLKG